MKQILYRLFSIAVVVFTVLALAVLGFVIYFIIREALPLFSEVSLSEFLLGDVWMPIDYIGTTSFGIFNFIMGTVAVSVLALIPALILGLGSAIWLSCVASQGLRNYLYPVIDLLAGIPSVIYGFIGLLVLVPLFMEAGVSTGLCVLAAAILLSVMLLPFLISSCSDSLLAAKRAYLPASNALGVSKWHCITAVLLPSAWKNILLSVILAIGRAMGETMAVMMVMGNANVFPTLLGKGETIASVIALEMGTAEVGSTHYHALYAAGLVLMGILFVINAVIGYIREKILK